jgi:hypothetical protein
MGPSCEQMVDFVKLYHACKSTTLIIEAMKTHHPGMNVLNKMLIYSLVRKFNVKDTIHETRQNSGSRRSMSACTKNKH